MDDNSKFRKEMIFYDATELRTIIDQLKELFDKHGYVLMSWVYGLAHYDFTITKENAKLGWIDMHEFYITDIPDGKFKITLPEPVDLSKILAEDKNEIGDYTPVERIWLNKRPDEHRHGPDIHEPDPIHDPNKESIWNIVIQDMKDRDVYGKKKHGGPLQVFDGRDSLWDAYQEVLDTAVYLRKAIREQELKRKNSSDGYSQESLISKNDLRAMFGLQPIVPVVEDMTQEDFYRAVAATPILNGDIPNWFTIKANKHMPTTLVHGILKDGHVLDIDASIDERPDRQWNWRLSNINVNGIEPSLELAKTLVENWLNPKTILKGNTAMDTDIPKTKLEMHQGTVFGTDMPNTILNVSNDIPDKYPLPFDFHNIQVFYQEIERVSRWFEDVVERRGSIVVTVGALLEVLNIANDDLETNLKYGWTDLSMTKVTKDPMDNVYILDLPEPMKLK